MLYYLFEWLHKLNFPGAGMFGYTSFRALMAIILALLISSIWGDKFINLLKRKQITETQRDAKIDPFGVNKVGVPSMGGVIIIVAILIPCLLLGKLHNIYMILMLITTVWLGSLGFADDYIKTVSYTHLDVYKRQDVLSALTQLSDIIAAHLKEGRTVSIDGLGNFYPSITSEAVDKPEECTANKVWVSRICFKAAPAFLNLSLIHICPRR